MFRTDGAFASSNLGYRQTPRPPPAEQIVGPIIILRECVQRIAPSFVADQQRSSGEALLEVKLPLDNDLAVVMISGG
jgi:hypothetical protein